MIIYLLFVAINIMLFIVEFYTSKRDITINDLLGGTIVSIMSFIGTIIIVVLYINHIMEKYELELDKVIIKREK